MRKIIRKVLNKIYSAPTVKYVNIYENDSRVSAILKILDEGYGHKKSFDLQKPVDSFGEPLPWFTYPAIEFLKQLNLSNMSVLEWGMGNSTLFFAPRVNEILSIEHNKEWFELIGTNLPKNATAILATQSEYSSHHILNNKKFDLIIVDGIHRKDCLETATRFLKDNGLIIFDNSDRNPELCEILRNKNFIENDFHGFGPINPYTWTTSFFFSKNCTIKPISVQPLIPIGGGY